MPALSKPKLKSSVKAKTASASPQKQRRNVWLKVEPIAVRREFSTLDESVFLREPEAAAILNVTAQSLKRLRLDKDPARRAQGPPVTIMHGRIRYKVGSLRTWIAALPTTSPTP